MRVSGSLEEGTRRGQLDVCAPGEGRQAFTPTLALAENEGFFVVVAPAFLYENLGMTKPRPLKTHTTLPRRIGFLVHSDCEIVDLCGPFDAFYYADVASRRLGRASSNYECVVLAARARQRPYEMRPRSRSGAQLCRRNAGFRYFGRGWRRKLRGVLQRQRTRRVGAGNRTERAPNRLYLLGRVYIGRSRYLGS